MTGAHNKPDKVDKDMALLHRRVMEAASLAHQQAAAWSGSPAELAEFCETIANSWLDLGEKAAALALRRTRH